MNIKLKNEKIIEVINLTKSYGDFLAVNHINFEVRAGEIFGFLGPNGAGKTTTIRMLTGLAKPSFGDAKIDRKEISKQIVEIKKIIGVVTEDSNLYDELSVVDNLSFIGQLYGISRIEREKKIGKLLKRLGLENKKDVKFAKLSKGMKRKVTIAAALVHNPLILFLDEPTTGLDVLSARVLRAMIKELNKEGVTIFLTTHYIEEAEQLCDTVAIIVDGKIKTLDTPKDLKLKTKSKSLEEAFIEITGLKEEIMLVEKEGRIGHE
jgi:ABC-2 type transport system ATP-binding protein